VPNVNNNPGADITGENRIGKAPTDTVPVSFFAMSAKMLGNQVLPGWYADPELHAILCAIS